MPNKAAIAEGIKYFERAIELAPDHAPGHAGLAEAVGGVGDGVHEMLAGVARDDEHLRRGRDPRAPRYASVYSRT